MPVDLPTLSARNITGRGLVHAGRSEMYPNARRLWLQCLNAFVCLHQACPFPAVSVIPEGKINAELPDILIPARDVRQGSGHERDAPWPIVALASTRRTNWGVLLCSRALLDKRFPFPSGSRHARLWYDFATTRATPASSSRQLLQKRRKRTHLHVLVTQY